MLIRDPCAISRDGVVEDFLYISVFLLIPTSYFIFFRSPISPYGKSTFRVSVCEFVFALYITSFVSIFRLYLKVICWICVFLSLIYQK